MLLDRHVRQVSLAVVGPVADLERNRVAAAVEVRNELDRGVRTAVPWMTVDSTDLPGYLVSNPADILEGERRLDAIASSLVLVVVAQPFPGRPVYHQFLEAGVEMLSRNGITESHKTHLILCSPLFSGLKSAPIARTAIRQVSEG